MKVMKIRWQRLVDEAGGTCSRCGATEDAVDRAAERLSAPLKALGIEVVVEKGTISLSEFPADTLQSNRLWIDGIALEEWLSGSCGSSRCDTTCGESDCRTITVDGREYEAIPSELIVQAGLAAAGARLPENETPGQCCLPAGTTARCLCPPPAKGGS